MTLGDLPVGAKVKFGKYQVRLETPEPIIWQIVAKNHPGYPTNAITLHTEKIIDLRCFDAREPNNTNNDRKSYGNNRYSVSNIDQWLNKDSAAGAWYTAQHSADAPPSSVNVNNNTQYENHSGFLHHFSTEEKNAILSTTLRAAKPSADGGGYEDITRKVFLLSTNEVGLGDEGGTTEGTALEFFTDANARITRLTTQAHINTLSDNKPSLMGNSWHWWLRTPNPSSARTARYVYGNGILYNGSVHDGYLGVRPALNLLSSLLVSDSVDTDGAYIIQWWTPPSIYPRISGVSRSYADGAVKIGGVWRTIDEVHVKVSNVWRKS